MYINSFLYIYPLMIILFGHTGPFLCAYMEITQMPVICSYFICQSISDSSQVLNILTSMYINWALLPLREIWRHLGCYILQICVIMALFMHIIIRYF